MNTDYIWGSVAVWAITMVGIAYTDDPPPPVDETWKRERIAIGEPCRAQLIIPTNYDKAVCDHVKHELRLEAIGKIEIEDKRYDKDSKKTTKATHVAVCLCPEQLKMEHTRNKNWDDLNVTLQIAKNTVDTLNWMERLAKDRNKKKLPWAP